MKFGVIGHRQIDFSSKASMMYIMQNVSVADARRRLAEILGRVAYGGDAFLITKKGKPMARLVPLTRAHSVDKHPATLGAIQGWLDDDDPFFSHLETARKESRGHKMKNPFHRKK